MLKDSVIELPHNKFLNKCVFGIVFLCIILYVGGVLSFSSNYPFWDDYDAILGFLNNFSDSQIKDRILSVFSQHNEHRIAFNRVVELIQYYVFGNVNFYYLVLIGNLGWLLTICLLSRHLRDCGYTLGWTIPIIVIMTSFAHYECMTWAMCSLQQYYQLLFSLITILFLVRQKVICTLLMLLLSIYTGGGGLVLIPLVFLYTLLHRDLRKFLIYNVSSLLILGLYFISYNKVGHHPSIMQALKVPIDLCEYILLIIGGVVKSRHLALIIGILAIPLFFIKIKTFYIKSPFVFWSMIFVVGVASVTGLSRVGFGVDQALSSRYKIYSILFWVLMYMKFIVITEQSYKKQFVLFVISFLCALSIFASWFKSGITYLENHETLISNSPVYPDLRSASNTLLKSEKILGYNYWRNMKWYVGVLNISEAIHKQGYLGCWSINKSVEQCVNNVDYDYKEETAKRIIISNDNKHLALDGWSVDPISNNSPCGTILKVDNNEYYSPIFTRKDVVKAFGNKMALYSGFYYDIDLSSFSKGQYTAEFITVGDDCKTVYTAGKYDVVVQ